MIKQMTKTPLRKMTTNRHSLLLKGKAIIFALSTQEKSQLFNSLDVHERQLVERIEHYCYGG